MNTKSGFTLIELVVVITIFLVILGLSWINLTSLPSRTSTQNGVEILVNDARSQQLNAMAMGSDYGIYMAGTYYVLFKGSVYNPNDTANFRVDLTDANLSFSNVLFSNQSIIFAKGSGEVENYTANLDSVSILNKLTSESKVIKINKYGATY